MNIQGDEARKAEFAEAYTKGKLEFEDNDVYYCLGYRYKGTLYVKIWESKSSRPDLYDQ